MIRPFTPELERVICARYPSLFGREGDAAPPRGIECEDGWFHLIDGLCSVLSPAIRITQIKEKLGTLRVYTESGDDSDDGAIQLATRLSSVICEATGRPGLRVSVGARLCTWSPDRLEGENFVRCVDSPSKSIAELGVERRHADLLADFPDISIEIPSGWSDLVASLIVALTQANTLSEPGDRAIRARIKAIHARDAALTVAADGLSAQQRGAVLLANAIAARTNQMTGALKSADEWSKGRDLRHDDQDGSDRMSEVSHLTGMPGDGNELKEEMLACFEQPAKPWASHEAMRDNRHLRPHAVPFETAAEFYRRTVRERLVLRGHIGKDLERRYQEILAAVPAVWRGKPGEPGAWPVDAPNASTAFPTPLPSSSAFTTPTAEANARVYQDYTDELGYRSAMIFGLQWRKLDEMTLHGIQYEIAGLKFEHSYIAGFFRPLPGILKENLQIGQLTFAEVFAIYLENMTDGGCYYPTTIAVNRTARGAAIAAKLLIWVIARTPPIVIAINRRYLPDPFWAWLAQYADITVQVVELETGLLLQSRARLRPDTAIDGQPADPFLEGQDESLMGVKLILRDVRLR